MVGRSTIRVHFIHTYSPFATHAVYTDNRIIYRRVYIYVIFYYTTYKNR